MTFSELLVKIVLFIYRKIRFHPLFLNKNEQDNAGIFYTQHFYYFKLLTPSEKRKFINRAIYLYKHNHHNISPQIKNTNNEVELLICAAFTQITFGYTDFELEKFNKIIVHPKVFYSRYINNHVKGLTVGSGYIHYSWEDFVKGYKIEGDKVNLALHELAHALYIDRFHKSDSYDWRAWRAKAVTIMENSDTTSLFRKYGKTNLDEFWAVSVECFFEDPITFKDEYPDFYGATAYVLRQDMALRKSLYSNTKKQQYQTVSVN